MAGFGVWSKESISPISTDRNAIADASSYGFWTDIHVS